jgi:hypothetical protein
LPFFPSSVVTCNLLTVTLPTESRRDGIEPLSRTTGAAVVGSATTF